MKQFVVSYISFFDNDLKMIKVQADCWKTSLVNANELFGGKEAIEWLIDASSLNEAKYRAFSSDCMFDVLEV